MLSPTLVRYLLIGAFTFGLDLVLLTAVHSGLGWPLPVAVTIGYAVALSVNYALNRVLNFRSHAPLGPESLRYAGAVAVNFGVVLLGVTTRAGGGRRPLPGGAARGGRVRGDLHVLRDALVRVPGRTPRHSHRHSHRRRQR